MKSVANSYSVELAQHDFSPAIRERIAALMPAIPNHVWLAMLLLAATLLGVSTLARARGVRTNAQAKHAVTASRLTDAQSANEALKAQTQQLRTNTRAAAQAVQSQLHYVKPNEVVIATP